ncbi:IclR family transcriptional regulator [Rhizobium grahamii]|uniref:IclR family transcriptional regulator n=1 Tax=Rhizobium grahamii TaxID=1120045 RepID=A0A5Q0C4U4_9HYPH|nr:MULTISPECIES: IclR family transcriptional regulator [Rhizobium]QFY60463.1 IclR family transcriptional regulator [Rhizobium grahamii]QRM50408.1 IclR family transcriptional regulator [Rhizobium sp. BG6]
MQTNSVLGEAKSRSTSDDSAGTIVQSVDRALMILDIIAAAGGVETLNNISSTSGLNVSTCHHLINTLSKRNYVVRAEGRGAYALGPQVKVIASSFNSEDDLLRRAEPWIDRINEVTGETVHLAMMQGDDLVTLVKRDARHAVRVDSGMIGKSAAAHATATGKALLAWMSETEVNRVLAAKGMRSFTPKTIVDAQALFADLENVRKVGFSIDHEEFQPHVVCIGAAIVSGGKAVASLSASTPIMRADEEHLGLIRDEVMAAAQALSLFNGAHND